jgi:hypothetical protein
MPTIVVGTQKNFSELRPVLFEGRVSAKAASEAADVIGEANPHADLEKLEPGTVLSIPDDVPGVVVKPAPPVITVGSSGQLGGLSLHGRVELDALAEAAKSQETAAKADRRLLAKAFDSTTVDAAMKKDKDLTADVEAARNALAEEDARAKERAAELKKAQAEWATGLDSMAELVRTLPGVSVVESRTRAKPS